MNHLIIAAAAVALLTGTGAATAQTANVGADVKVHGAADAKARASTQKRHHRATTGIETRDNNASARGSILPGKDRLNSKAYIADH